MTADQLKSRIANLSEESQDAFAEIALKDMLKRVQLEKLAAGSIWDRYRMMILPIAAAIALIAFRDSLEDYFTYIIVFILIVMQAFIVTTHSRIDAIYELMKNHEGRMFTDNQKAEQDASSNH
jgi:hypothetical protein